MYSSAVQPVPTLRSDHGPPDGGLLARMRNGAGADDRSSTGTQDGPARALMTRFPRRRSVAVMINTHPRAESVRQAGGACIFGASILAAGRGFGRAGRPGIDGGIGPGLELPRAGRDRTPARRLDHAPGTELGRLAAVHTARNRRVGGRAYPSAAHPGPAVSARCLWPLLVAIEVALGGTPNSSVARPRAQAQHA